MDKNHVLKSFNLNGHGTTEPAEKLSEEQFLELQTMVLGGDRTVAERLWLHNRDEDDWLDQLMNSHVDSDGQKDLEDELFSEFKALHNLKHAKLPRPADSPDAPVGGLPAPAPAAPAPAAAGGNQAGLPGVHVPLADLDKPTHLQARDAAWSTNEDMPRFNSMTQVVGVEGRLMAMDGNCLYNSVAFMAGLLPQSSKQVHPGSQLVVMGLREAVVKHVDKNWESLQSAPMGAHPRLAKGGLAVQPKACLECAM